DQYAVRPGNRRQRAERAGRERLPAQGEGGRPRRGGERDPVGVGERERERARPAGERQRAAQRRAGQAVRKPEERGQARDPGKRSADHDVPVRPGPVQEQRPEREERVLAIDVAVRVAGATDEVVPVEIPGEERPEALVLQPARGPRVRAGREADRERGQQRAEPDQPDCRYAKSVAPGHGATLWTYAAETSSFPSCFCHHSDSRRWISVCAFAT